MTFGYGAKFPVKYREAFFMCDWSYGKLYAVHLKAQGASYAAEAEEFLNGSPLPLTDIVINPKEGAMYFAIGGRSTMSGVCCAIWQGWSERRPWKQVARSSPPPLSVTVADACVVGTGHMPPLTFQTPPGLMW